MTKMLSIGNNQKLGKKIAVFNLPQGITCPGKTEWCAKHCYTIKAERIYKAAKDMRYRNLERAKSPDFKEDMITELKSLKKVTMLRVHESGDFLSQQYIDNWFDIARAFPSITFLAYTKSFMFDFANKPDNFSILFSLDKTTTLEAPKVKWARFAYTVSKEEAIPANYKHTCNQMLKSGKIDKHYCGVSCLKCWHNCVKNIYFAQH